MFNREIHLAVVALERERRENQETNEHQHPLVVRSFEHDFRFAPGLSADGRTHTDPHDQSTLLARMYVRVETLA